ncbi:hypothetical protein B0H17DRAFT_1269373 [Mycena rosella]|uniref:Uncharacterized protein n=1 Tax=Mycena rosella TaxID=1033263 RepID=A0AAD7DPR8_MYCRO|nr:hypothetical protein B0H17DRAFT_1269373 [Mycena rosella]
MPSLRSGRSADSACFKTTNPSLFRRPQVGYYTAGGKDHVGNSICGKTYQKADEGRKEYNTINPPARLSEPQIARDASFARQPHIKAGEVCGESGGDGGGPRQTNVRNCASSLVDIGASGGPEGIAKGAWNSAAREQERRASGSKVPAMTQYAIVVMWSKRTGSGRSYLLWQTTPDRH